MKMYIELYNYLSKSNLLKGTTVQYLGWRDIGQDKIYLVFRPNGGSDVSNSLANEYYLLVDFIAQSNDSEKIDDLVNNVVNYIKKNQFDAKLGNIQVKGNIPAPIQTVDDRLVYRLLISIQHG